MAERHAPDVFSLVAGLFALGGAVLFFVDDLGDVRLNGAVIAAVVLVLLGALGLTAVARKGGQGSLE